MYAPEIKEESEELNESMSDNKVKVDSRHVKVDFQNL